MTFRDDKKIEKIEDQYFMYLSLSQTKELTSKELKKFMKIMDNRLKGLEFEFIVAKQVLSKSNKGTIIINNGLNLINDLKEGLQITKENPIQDNIEQWAAHFDSVLSYEEDTASFITTGDDEIYNKTFESFTDAKELSDGYIKKEEILGKKYIKLPNKKQ